MASANGVTSTLAASGLVILLLLCPKVAGQCDKFSSQTPKTVVQLDGVCYYGFEQLNHQWQQAQDFCEAEGTHLPHVQTAEKQEALYQALGVSFSQHWVGLRYIDNKWQWYYDATTQIDASSDVPTSRWEGGFNSGECAYTMTTTVSAYLKPISLTAWYRPVCEDGGSLAQTTTTVAPTTTSTTTPEPTTTSAPTTTTAAPTTTTPLTTTTSTTTTSSSPPQPGQASTGIFHKQTSLPFFIPYTSTTSVSKLACALYCIRTSGCQHFAFMKTTGNCAFHDNNAGSIFNQSCSGDSVCFSRM